MGHPRHLLEESVGGSRPHTKLNNYDDKLSCVKKRKINEVNLLMI